MWQLAVLKNLFEVEGAIETFYKRLIHCYVSDSNSLHFPFFLFSMVLHFLAVTQVHIPSSNTQLKVIVVIFFFCLTVGQPYHESEPTADILSGNQSIVDEVTRELHMHWEFPPECPGISNVNIFNYTPPPTQIWKTVQSSLLTLVAAIPEKHPRSKSRVILGCLIMWQSHCCQMEAISWVKRK